MNCRCPERVLPTRQPALTVLMSFLSPSKPQCWLMPKVLPSVLTVISSPSSPVGSRELLFLIYMAEPILSVFLKASQHAKAGY